MYCIATENFYTSLLLGLKAFHIFLFSIFVVFRITIIQHSSNSDKKVIKKFIFEWSLRLLIYFLFWNYIAFIDRNIIVITELPAGTKRKKQPPSKCWESQMVRKYINKPCYLFHEKIKFFNQSTTYKST